MEDVYTAIQKILAKDSLSNDDKAFLKARASYLKPEQLKGLDLDIPEVEDEEEVIDDEPVEESESDDEETPDEEADEVDLAELDEAGLRELADSQNIKLGNVKDVEKIRTKIAEALA